MLESVTGLFRGRTTLEQHLAVFGESGSGKTTLLSAFYGWQQEPAFRAKSGYGVNAVDTTTGQRLRASYLKMAESLLPPQTRYSHEPIEFTIRVRGLDANAGKLVWHDYPGEWWTETKTGTEGNRKLDTFRTLLRSDVALILVDGARVKKDKGRYIRELIRGFREELERQKEALVREGERLNPFPRVWILCLSKSDLFPEKKVFWFRDQVIEAAADELHELRHVIGEIIGGDQFKSIGEDFLLLSSAKFDSETGKVLNADQHVGLDMIMPLAIAMPIKKALTWSRAKEVGATSIHRLSGMFRSCTTNWLKYLPLVGNVFWLVDDTAKSGLQKLKDVEDAARARGDAVESVVAALAARLSDESTQNVYYSSSESL
jgi:GTPase SAR1 family protein